MHRTRDASSSGPGPEPLPSLPSNPVSLPRHAHRDIAPADRLIRTHMRNQHGLRRRKQNCNRWSSFPGTLRNSAAGRTRRNSALFYEYITSATLRLANADMVGVMEIQSFNGAEVGAITGRAPAECAVLSPVRKRKRVR